MGRETLFYIEDCEFEDQNGCALSYPDLIHVSVRSDGDVYEIEDVVLPGAGPFTGRNFPAPKYIVQFIESWAASDLALDERSTLRQAYNDRVSLHGREDRANDYADYVRDQRAA